MTRGPGFARRCDLLRVAPLNFRPDLVGLQVIIPTRVRSRLPHLRYCPDAHSRAGSARHPLVPAGSSSHCGADGQEAAGPGTGLGAEDAQERLIDSVCGPRWAQAGGLAAPFAFRGADG